MKHLNSLLLCVVAAVPAAALELPAVWSDHAVLQRDTPLLVWGWGDPGEQVTIELKGQTRETVANADGRWEATLDALPASAGRPR